MLESSASGWDKDSVACATVLEIEDKFYMWYCGANIASPTEFTYGVGLAVADRPIGPWEKVGLIIAEFGYVSSVIHHNGLYWMYSEYPVKRQYSAWEHLLDGTTVTPDCGPVSLAIALAPEGPYSWDRMGVGTMLRRTVTSSNPIESCLSTVQPTARNAKRWRGGDHALRWTPTGLLKAEKKSRKVKGFRELEILHLKLNPSLTQHE